MSSWEVSEANPWQLVRKNEAFDCRYFVARNDTVRLGDGDPRPYTYVKMKHYGVAVAPIDHDGKTVLVGQYRYVLDRFTWELPRGGGKKDAPPIEAAKAELHEETGCTADHWLLLFEAAASPGLTDEVSPCFVAWGLHAGDPRPDADERIVQQKLPFADAVGMALSGKISDLASIALLLGIQARLARNELPADLMRLLRAA